MPAVWWLFHVFVAIHIAAGAIGLVSFWVPVIGRKGGKTHRRYGDVFARCILVAGVAALCMSLCTLSAPLDTHPRFTDSTLVRGIFGWMMLYLSTLTISLVWHGTRVVINKADHVANRAPFPVALQIAAIVTAVNCEAIGVFTNQPLMMGIPLVGIASGLTNLRFIFNDAPTRLAYVKEHLKASVGAGISVYTAFMTFGLARLLPSQAFNPTLWAIPIVIGISIISWHTWRLREPKRAPVEGGLHPPYGV